MNHLHGAQVTIRCHRCKVLGVECSFETSDFIHVSPQTPSHPSPAETSSSSSPSFVAGSPFSVTESYGGLNTLATVASSRPNAAENRPNSAAKQYRINVEDLVPTATTPIWGSLSRVDWTAAPMLAIQELVRCPSAQDPNLQLPSGERLSDILSPPEITSLLEIFETRYTPWLCAQPGPLESKNSLLDLARCTIASRHMVPEIRSTIAPRLQKLTEEVFLREVFNPQASLESIRALLILSVWTPICGTGAEGRDGRLLIASAVSMAMNLHLQDESKRATSLRAEEGHLSSEKQAELNESMLRWRLWMYLSISESMLCIGTGRPPVSHLSQLDLEMITLSSFPQLNVAAVRDFRLGITAKLFNLAETALKVRLKSVNNLETFFDDINACIYSMEGLNRLLSPLSVVTQCDAFYSQMLILQYNACKLLIIHHALREIRTTWERDAPEMPWYAVETRGQIPSLFWGHVGLQNSETVLSTFLAVSDLTLLSCSPDNVFVMVGFAATWIFVTNYTLHQLGNTQLVGASEHLQNMTIERLTQIAHAPDHAAARCGYFLRALMNAWEQRRPQPGLLSPTDICKLEISYARFPVPFLTCVEFPANNSDLFMDDAFWTSFVANLNSDTFTVDTSVGT
ncbi:hypothetical protein MSAN_01059800 [Mycena sanguinolenta]|uniref:Xylanolytic transcriptional activator regulatory domain-containing protein n=1 Tax=Mycena sanguinolenta TaxID=230812 RepID=A0A8H6YTF5_9AGAR|nr:hypothetical protein MSAN_01059800 [Mycena sanguinolenta]